jgi:hypothetical protein
MLFVCIFLSTHDRLLHIVYNGPYHVCHTLQRNLYTLLHRSHKSLLRDCYHTTCVLKQICILRNSRSTTLYIREALYSLRVNIKYHNTRMNWCLNKWYLGDMARCHLIRFTSLNEVVGASLVKM